MTLPADYVTYPQRHYGMDHNYYEWSSVPSRQPINWPSNARVALCVAPALEWFPLDMGSQPFVPPGGLTRPYPDYWNYTYRDYGNRVGIYRIFEMLDKLGLRASITMNSAIAVRYPTILGEINRREWEIVASGVDMGHLHHDGLSEAQERDLIRQSLSTLREASGQPITGWWSPANSASERTLDLVSSEGIEYICDWNNDDQPYEMHTSGRDILSVPHSSELSDRQIILTYHHSTQEFAQELMDAYQSLDDDASDGSGRVLCITLHPWISGQPHRIRAISNTLAEIAGRDGVWAATLSEVASAARRVQAKA